MLSVILCCLCVVGSDNKIFIWNVGTGEILNEMEFPDIPLSASWSWDGAKLVVSTKDRKVRIVDPRRGEFLHVSIVLYLYIYIALPTVHTNQERFQCEIPREKRAVLRERKEALGSPVNKVDSVE